MPTLISRDGQPFRTENPTEITRLRSRGYEIQGEVFHPADHTVAEVNAYLAEHPEDADRVIAEERKAEKPRVSINGVASADED